MGVNRNELKYIGYATLFAFIFFGLIIPALIRNNKIPSNIYLQFFIFNLGVFLFFQIFLKISSLNLIVKIRETLGIISLFMALDVLTPPLLINLDGTLLSGSLLFGSASDYVIGYTLISIGLKGFFVFLATYALAPFILLLLSSLLLKNFVKNL